MSDSLVERVLLTLQRRLLGLAPRAFRERFGEELLDCARESLRDARRRRGSLAGFAHGLRQSLDIGLTALRLPREPVPARTTRVLLPLAALFSLGTGWIDAHQDEVQPAALLLFLGAATFAFLDSGRAWLGWLVLGLSIPGARWVLDLRGASAGQGPFLATFLAFLPAGFGALTGLALRKAVPRSPGPGAPI